MDEIDTIRVRCRTCELRMDITKDDLEIMGYLAATHSSHEIWVVEPGTEDDFQLRFTDVVDDILRHRRYRDRQAMSE